MFTCPSTDVFPITFFAIILTFCILTRQKPQHFEVNNPTEELF